MPDVVSGFVPVRTMALKNAANCFTRVETSPPQYCVKNFASVMSGAISFPWLC